MMRCLHATLACNSAMRHPAVVVRDCVVVTELHGLLMAAIAHSAVCSATVGTAAHEICRSHLQYQQRFVLKLNSRRNSITCA